MKKLKRPFKICAFAAGLAALTLAVASCVAEEEKEESLDRRFVYENDYIEFAIDGLKSNYGYVLEDTETGSEYLVVVNSGIIRLDAPTDKEPSFREIWHDEAVYMAKTIWGEARGCSKTDQAAVAWCILNRVDHPAFGSDIISVITAKSQFSGYDYSNPVDPEHYELAMDVIERWQIEKEEGSVTGRVLPKDYLYFTGNGKQNHFSKEYGSKIFWDGSCVSPYGGDST